MAAIRMVKYFNINKYFIRKYVEFFVNFMMEIIRDKILKMVKIKIKEGKILKIN
jgi:hypothetical protein